MNYICSILLVSIMQFSSCLHDKKNNSDNHVKGNTIFIFDPDRSFRTTLYLGNKWTWGMEVLENSLNDTAMVGVVKIPPQKMGTLFRIECFIDSLSIDYKPYRAAKGKLVLKYFSGN